MFNFNRKSEINAEEIARLILFAALLFGTLFRFFPTIIAGFPVNDGGMFYIMMKDIQANHFLPPFYTTYNNLNIPFAYPPLALYTGAGVSSLFNISGIEILRWLPATFNSMCLLAFYFLSKEILNDKLKGSVATLVFAFIPHMTTWLSAGGGLTRSLGTLFMMLTVLFAYRFYIKNDLTAIAGIIIFGSLTALSHTESVVFAITIPIYVWLAKSRKLKAALQSGWVALAVICVAGPWYGLIIFRHGIEPLLSAASTGGQTIWFIFRLINFNLITEEPYIDLLGTLSLLGIIFLIIKKEYFLPGMFILINIVQPRSAHTIGNIPLAIAAGLFIVETIIPAIANISNKVNTSSNHGFKVFLAILTPYLIINSTYQGFLLANNHISPVEQSTMRWVKENTPQSAKFLILSSEMDSACEITSEWFPALSERESIATFQGKEWLPGNQYSEIIGHWPDLQICIDEGLACLNRESAYLGADYDYVYVSVQTHTNNCNPIKISSRPTRALIIELENSNEYSITYHSKETFIFEKIK